MALPALLSPSKVIMLRHFVFKIHQEELILLLHKVVLMQQKTTKVMVILFTDFSTILLKVVIIDHVKLTYIG